MVMTVMYNGIQFAPVSCKQSLVVPHSADILWSVVGKFGGMALWMGTVEGQPIFSQLLVTLCARPPATVAGAPGYKHYLSPCTAACQATLAQLHTKGALP